MIPDLTGLTFTQVAIMALVLAAADTVWNIVVSLANHTFSSATVAQFLESHVLLRIVPILLLAVLGSGQFGLTAIPVFFDGALAALTAYAVETVGSIMAANKTSAPSA